MQSQLAFKGHKYPIDFPSEFSVFCKGVLQRFKGQLPYRWDLVFIKEDDSSSRTVFDQEDYKSALKLLTDDIGGKIEIRESNESNCTSFKLNDKENLDGNLKKSGSQKIETIVSKKDTQEKNKRPVLQERDPNRAFGESLEENMKEETTDSILKEKKVLSESDDFEEKDQSLSEEYQRLTKDIEVYLDLFGIPNIEHAKNQIQLQNEEDEETEALKVILEMSERAESLRLQLLKEEAIEKDQKQQILQHNIEGLKKASGNSDEPNVESPEESLELKPDPEDIANSEKDKIKSTIKDLEEDVKDMPNCFERFLIFIYILILRKFHSEYSESESSEVVDEKIPKVLSALEERAQLEGLDNSSIKKTLDKIKSQIKNLDWRSLKDCLGLLLKQQIRPLNVKELERLVKKGSEAADLIRRKDAIIFVGQTGVGKSTTILYLSKVKLSKKKLNKGFIYIPEGQINSALEGVTTSANSKSETRYIKCIPIKLSDLGIPKTGEIYYVDLPAFGDTDGAEVEISNFINIYRTICECKSVKPVIIVSEKSLGDRMPGIRDLAHILAGIMPGIHQSVENSPFTYLFTKFSPEESEALHGRVKDVLENLTPEEAADKAFCNIIEDIMEKIEDGPQVIDPLKPDQVKKIVRSIQGSKSILQPNQVFRFSIPEKAKATLKDQCEVNQKTIKSATERNDFELVIYKLSELKTLSELVKLEFIEESYFHSIQFVVKYLEKHSHTSVDKFNSFLKDGNTLESQHVKDYVEQMKISQAADLLRDKYLPKETPASSAFLQNITAQVSQILTKIKQSSINDLSLKSLFEKLELLSQHLESVKPDFQNSVRNLNIKFEESIELFKSLHSNNEFNKAVQLLRDLDRFINLFKTYFNEETITQKLNSVKEFFSEDIKGTVSGLNSVFNKNGIESEDVEKIKKCTTRLQSAKANYKNQLFAPDVIDRVYNDTLQRCLGYMNGNADRISRLYEEERYGSLSEIEQCFNEMHLLRTIPEVAAETHEVYYKTLESIRSFSKDIKNDMLEEIKKCQTNQSDDYDYADLHNYFIAYQALQWIDLYKQDSFLKIKKTIENEVLRHSEIERKKLEQYQLDLNNFNQLEAANRIALRLRQMSTFENFLPALGRNKEIIKSSFEDRLQATLATIKSLLNKWNTEACLKLDGRRIEKSLLYLRQCHKLSLLNPELNQEASILLQELETFIQKSSQQDFEKFEKDHQALLNYNLQATSTEEFGNSIRSSMTFLQSQNDRESSHDQLSDNLSSVSERPDVTSSIDREGLGQYARRMLKLLKQATQFKRDFPNFYEIYDLEEEPLIDYWKMRLDSDFRDLSEQMQKLSSSVNMNQELKKKLHICRTLGTLDEFVDANKFMDLYKSYQTKYENQTTKKFNEYLQSIKNADTRQIPKAIRALKDCNPEDIACSDQYEELKDCLSDLREDLMTQIKSMAHQVFFEEKLPNPEKIHSIIVNKNKLKELYESLKGQDLNFPVKDLEKCQERVEKMLSQELEYLMERYKNLIISENYVEAEKQRLCFNQISIALGEKFEEELPKKSQQFDTIRDSELKEIMSQFDKMPISDYTYHSPNPKEIYSKLELPKDDIYYKNIRDKFKKTIKEKCWAEIQRIESLDLVQKSAPLKTIRSLLDSLPQSVEADVAKKLDELQGNLNTIKKRFDVELQTVKKNPDVKKSAELLKSFKQMRVDEDLEELEEHLLKDADTLKSDFMKNLYTKNSRTAFNQFVELHEKNTHWDVKDINKFYIEARASLMQITNNMYNSLSKGLNSSETLSLDKHSVEEVVKSFLFLGELIKFREDRNTQLIFQDMLSDQQISNINTIVKEFVSNYKKVYEDAFDDSDLIKISKVLTSVQNCSHLIDCFRTYACDETASLKNILMQIEPSASLQEKLTQRILELSEGIANVDLINEETKRLDKTRNEFLNKLNLNLLNMEKLAKFEGLGSEIKSLLKQAYQRINTEKKQIYQLLDQKVNQIFEESIEPEEDVQFDIYYNNLVAITKILKSSKVVNCGDAEEIDQKFKKKMGQYANEILSENLQVNSVEQLKKIAEGLQKLKALALSYSVFKTLFETKIDEILASYKSKRGHAGITKLGQILGHDSKGHESRIVSDCQIFQGVANSVFKARTNKHGIEYVLDHLKGDGIHKEFMRRAYNDFKEIYRELILLNLKPELDLRDLVSNTKVLAGNIIQTSENMKWDSEVTSKIPELLAHIFAVWTLQNIGNYWEDGDLTNRDNELREPHAAQVVSIFRMLGVGEERSELQNNLVQIGTGAGKSITLAATAIVLALLGFNIFSACYSSYLSERDFQAFSSLFSLFDVSDKIKYGTFNTICEDVINQDGDVRKLVENLFMNGITNAPELIKISICPCILLIDEVDVFFSREFYGKLYTPSASIRDPTITKVMDLIWNNRESQYTFAQVKETEEYQACCTRFSHFKSIIEEAVKDMLFDLKEYRSHDYVVKDDKIGYKHNENISFKMVSRYQTLFAYYLEHEKQNISAQSLEENKRLIIKAGSFSYAEIVRKFNYIMGVTGTLQDLSPMEKQVIENDYQIKKKRFSPSVYGANVFDFEEKAGVIIANSNDYFNALKQEIFDQMISGKTKDIKRPILVFFESKKELTEFLNWSEMAEFKDTIQCLTEEANAEEKENIVKRATYSGRITYLTRSFGRGTDFVVYDQAVRANRGVHVIQTFLSEEQSEEVQIKGRTARQGGHGSYSMVILDQSLEKYHILPEDLENIKKEGRAWNRLKRLVTKDPAEYKNAYELMKARRNELFARTYKNNEKLVVQAKEAHVQAMKFLEDIAAQDLNAIKLFLAQENKGASEVEKTRTIIMFDATRSMDQTLQYLILTLGTTIQNTGSISQDYGIPEDVSQIQLVVYRNYNCKEDKLLQFSPWETKSDALRAFLNTISVEGGMGNEAIEVALSHANKQSENEKISQIILIGDAPPNTVEEVTSKRMKRFGENYWKTTKFATKTDYVAEVRKLKEKNIPVHSFYIKESAKNNFTEISDFTGGKCASLDIYSEAGATTLTNSITETLLRQIGQENGKGDELAEAFRSKIVQSFS